LQSIEFLVTRTAIILSGSTNSKGCGWNKSRCRVA
jgi:hypothetical protein